MPTTIEPFDSLVDQLQQCVNWAEDTDYLTNASLYRVERELRAERGALRAKILALKDDPSCVTVEAAVIKAAGMV
jgi:hypothetical protein